MNPTVANLHNPRKDRSRSLARLLPVVALVVAVACSANKGKPGPAEPSATPAPAVPAAKPTRTEPVEFKAFEAAHPRSGERAPGFELRDLEGKQLSLHQATRQRPVVLVFGSFSCPLFRMKTPNFEKLARRFAGQALFLLVYSAEAHPEGEGSAPINAFAERMRAMDTNGDGVISRAEYQGPPYMFDAFDLNSDNEVRPHELVAARRIDQFRQFPAPQHMAERVAGAQRFRREVPGSIPVLIDTMDNRTSLDYGGLPNMAFVIARGGTVRAKLAWASAPRVEAELNALLGRPVSAASQQPPAWGPAAESLHRATRAQRRLLIEFVAPGCVHCARMKTTLADPAVVAALGRFERVTLDVSTDAVWSLFEAVPLERTPGFVLVDPGPPPAIVDRAQGYQEAASFTEFLSRHAL
jgi:hypothetical protein